MKEKKNKGARKVLLMMISVVLVAAISVSATLAYLTAQTDEKVNSFTPSGGITGEVLEPSFNNSSDYTYNPGNEIAKDPLIQNTTTDASIYVGAKLDFYIKVTGDTYTQVSYDKFAKYVAIKYGSTTGFNTTNWTDVTSQVKNNDNGSKYFVYKTAIGKADTTNPTSANNYAGADSTQPIFTSVTPSANIRIETLPAYTGDTRSYTTTIDDAAPSSTKIYQSSIFRLSSQVSV